VFGAGVVHRNESPKIKKKKKKLANKFFMKI
jgi:hypothetical protein